MDARSRREPSHRRIGRWAVVVVLILALIGIWLLAVAPESFQAPNPSEHAAADAREHAAVRAPLAERRTAGLQGREDARRAPLTADVPDHDRVAPPPDAWRACFEGDAALAARLECLDRALAHDGVPNPEAVADALCTGAATPTFEGRTLGAVCVHLDSRAFWPWIARFQAACPSLRETCILLDAFRAARLADPAWAQRVLASMTAREMFDPERSDGPVQLLELFATDGDPVALHLVAEGGRGCLGGSARQIERAAAVALVVEKDAARRLEYMESLLRSTTLPGDVRLGSLCASFLALDRGAWPGGDCRPAFELLARVLDDPRFGKAAAATLTQATIDAPQCAELLRMLREHAQRVLDTH
ncbi:MAG: hypothetical protein HZA53_04845 [Planctomycetes bacterium]|nr:hypothetical protein [Planctomycetota bacterium]